MVFAMTLRKPKSLEFRRSPKPPTTLNLAFLSSSVFILVSGQCIPGCVETLESECTHLVLKLEVFRLAEMQILGSENLSPTPGPFGPETP